ncbi:HPr family phosphocarrier protein [Sutcliffiella horikoshii]|uniref:HPr family phosphocarrier protein n=1 Tax=Sutcliffiella horikoshii TaxID=79883 RepID=UPI00203BE296|nr:HPr family phosphocarrier protein [Sutcliffiella horikoshii]MCM3616586.1 HPr family phosphocarrier protein [Sutcliffiella horikoshii]
MVSKQITVALEFGLHSKAAQYFVGKANEFVAEITVIRHNRIIDAKSILGLMSLGIANGNVVTVKAEGEDEKEAVESLTRFLKGEETE